MELPDPKEFFKQNTTRSRKSKLENAINDHSDLKPWLDELLTMRLEGMAAARRRGMSGNNVLSLVKLAKMANTSLGTNLSGHDISYYWQLHFEEKLNELTRLVEDDGSRDQGSQAGAEEALLPPGVHEDQRAADPVCASKETQNTGTDLDGVRGRTLPS